MNILYNVDALLMVKQSDIICSPCIFRFWGAPNTFFSVSSYAQGICALFCSRRNVHLHYFHWRL